LKNSVDTGAMDHATMPYSSDYYNYYAPAQGASVPVGKVGGEQPAEDPRVGCWFLFTSYF